MMPHRSQAVVRRLRLTGRRARRGRRQLGAVVAADIEQAATAAASAAALRAGLLFLAAGGATADLIRRQPSGHRHKRRPTVEQRATVGPPNAENCCRRRRCVGDRCEAAKSGSNAVFSAVWRRQAFVERCPPIQILHSKGFTAYGHDISARAGSEGAQG